MNNLGSYNNTRISPNHIIYSDMIIIIIISTQGLEEMCLSLEQQNPSKTSEKMSYFDRVTVSLHIL